MEDRTSTQRCSFVTLLSLLKDTRLPYSLSDTIVPSYTINDGTSLKAQSGHLATKQRRGGVFGMYAIHQCYWNIKPDMLIKWFIARTSGGYHSLVSKKGGSGENFFFFFFFRSAAPNRIKATFMCMCILSISV